MPCAAIDVQISEILKSAAANADLDLVCETSDALTRKSVVRFTIRPRGTAPDPDGLSRLGRVRLLLIADTHIPKRARDLPPRVWEEVATADVVIHAGDWIEPQLLDTLERRAHRLVACWGNNDGAELRRRLPERADATLGGLRFTVVHETGAATGREARMAKAYPDTDVLVFGHSHIPWDSTARTGLRLLNPGSPTDRRRQPYCTYMTARVHNATLTDVTLHELH